MARNHTQHRTTAIVLLILTLASCSLTACSSSAPQARSLSPQEVASQKKRDAGILEIVSCARHHGVRLPPPTAAGVNVSAVKGRRREEAVSACYQKVLKKAARQARAEQAERAR